MWALAGNVRSFLHRFALGAAILSGGYTEQGLELPKIHWIATEAYIIIRRNKPLAHYPERN
jgi:hypothetical protein